MFGVNIINLITSLFLAGLGALIRFKRAGWLIAGYNTSSKSEKEKYDEVALCNYVGNLMFILASIIFIMSIVGFLDFINFNFIMIFGWSLFVIVTLASVVYTNTGNRFKKL